MSSAPSALPSSGEIHRRRLFLGCFVALIATAFGFIIRALILEDWRIEFNLSQEKIGTIGGAGLYPFAITIILFSLIVDRVGYGNTMVFAFICHAVSAVITFLAGYYTDSEWGYRLLYIGTFIFALGNGTVEAVINPVVATIYERNKTHWLNILHAGWPGGLVLGGVLTILLGNLDLTLPATLKLWQVKVGLVLLPTIVYGLLLLGQRFPVQERVAAGVSYLKMLKEFGAASFLIVMFLLVLGVDQILRVFQTNLLSKLYLAKVAANLASAGLPQFWAEMLVHLGIAAIPTIVFLAGVRALGRPMFVFLLLVMFLLATTELGTDSWIADIMTGVLQNADLGGWVLVYTSSIMFVLRFFAGPIVHRISPLGLLAFSAAIAAGGLFWLSMAGSDVKWVFAAATLYACGKTFFWPTTLGVVSEQYPQGGALMLNAIAGVGMISVGVLGNPGIGVLQDKGFEQRMVQEAPALFDTIVKHEPIGMLGPYNTLNQEKRTAMHDEMVRLYAEARAGLPEGATEDQVLAAMTAENRARYQQLKADLETIDRVLTESRQAALGKIAILPAIMFICYVLLILYFVSRGGYKPQTLAANH